MATNWNQIGQQLADSLKTVTTNEEISSQCKAVIDEINKTYESLNSKKKPLSIVRKAIKDVFPDTQKQAFNYQYFTTSGKGSIERWEHLALKYLTLSDTDWSLLGNDNRKNYTESKIETNNTEEEPMITTVEKVSADDFLNQFRKLSLKVNKKYVDKTIQDAINESGKGAEEFIKTALLIYSRSIIGKSKNDLTTISTDDLLNNKKYSTVDGRAEELVKRAIKAIKIYNDEIASENSDRWVITQTALAELTGAKASSIKEALTKYKDDLDSYHDKYEMREYNKGSNSWTLKVLMNRKPGLKIKEIVNLVELVPYGVE